MPPWRAAGADPDDRFFAPAVFAPALFAPAVFAAAVFTAAAASPFPGPGSAGFRGSTAEPSRGMACPVPGFRRKGELF